MDTLSQSQIREYRRTHGMPQERGVERDGVAEAPDPSRGGARGYPVPERIRLLQMWKEDKSSVPKSILCSIRRWNKRLIPLQMTGGKASRAMAGHHRLLLAIFKKFYPQAKRKQCAVFIAIYSHDQRVFTDTEITNALKDMGMTRKKGSTTAYQAFTPKNLQLHYNFWHCPFPKGVANILRKDLIDVDEMAIVISDADEKYGHAVKNCRVRKIGNYGRGAFKITLIMAVEAGNPDINPTELGSIEKPRIWYHLCTDAGTSTKAYVDFLNYDLMDNFFENEGRRVIMHDNLSSHKSPEVAEAIYLRGHRVKCRVPYRPNEAPIEWVFDMIGCEIRRRWESIKNETQLIANVHDIIKTRKGLGGFDDTFIRCGYTNE